MHVSESEAAIHGRTVRRETRVLQNELRSDALNASMNAQPVPILSPCVGVCRLGADGLCEGCLRSGEEIARWIAMGEAERRRIVEQVLPAREAERR
jgi:predicted Fe-S protein YdhL (DUF1289 family)